jgi:uncharacterized glyoxalase superfamily protein PhnB
MPASTSVFLNVRDIEKSLEFYRRLGFRVKNAWKDEETGQTGYADLDLQGAELSLGHIPSNDDPEFQAWVGTPLGAGVVVYLTVPNVDRHWKVAQEMGATIEMPIKDRPYGRMFTLNDPDGYTLSFITEPRRAAPRKKAAARKAAPKKASRKAAPKKAARKAAPKKAARKARKARKR